MATTQRPPTILPEIEAKREEIVALCRRFGVQRLDLFGSATTGAFDPATSDYDFIVHLGAYEPGIAHRFFGLQDALTETLGRDVDLNSEPSDRNPYYLDSVAESRVTFYESRDSEAFL